MFPYLIVDHPKGIKRGLKEPIFILEREDPLSGGGKAQGKFFHYFRFDVCGKARVYRHCKKICTSLLQHRREGGLLPKKPFRLPPPLSLKATTSHHFALKKVMKQRHLFKWHSDPRRGDGFWLNFIYCPTSSRSCFYL